MSFTVTLQPSGRRFLVEHGETLLEAALRSGISLDYKCINGTCGECRARIVSGEVGAIAQHDFVIREVDKRQGVVLLCRTVPATDLVVEALVARTPEDIPRQTVITRVDRIDEPTPQVRIIQLRTPRSQTLRFLAGQTVSLEIDGVASSTRAIASCPCNGMFLQFHIRRNDDDPFARHVFEALRLRDCITVAGPQGRFILDEESTRPLIFLARGTGFAPIKSLIEQCFNLELTQSVTLYWDSDFARQPYLANYCRSWENAFDNFRYVPMVDETRRRTPSEQLAQVARCICSDHPDLERSDLYASIGESNFETAQGLLLEGGLPANRLFIDRSL